MSKLKLMMYVFIALTYSGCFKLGYQIEFGNQEQPMQQEPSSGYYYKAPTYYTR